MSEIDQSSNLVSAGGYLTSEELELVKISLNALHIKYIVRGHGPGKYESQYYEVIVFKKDFEVTRKVIIDRKNKTKVKGRQCPKCKSLVYLEVEKNSLWEKIYYYGTTLVQCKRCKTRYTI